MIISKEFNNFLNEKQLHRYAEVLLWGLKKSRKDNFRKKNIVLIRFDLYAIRLAEILKAKLLDMGINTIVRCNLTPRMEHDFFSISDENQLSFISPGKRELYNKLNGLISLSAPNSITHLQHVNPNNITKVSVYRKHLRNILDSREQAGKFGWTLCIVPTIELAKHAKLAYKEYASQVIKSCFLDYKNPVSHWESVFNEVKELKKWLNSLKVSFLKIESENIDLVITPGKNRVWAGVSGHNIPSFELYISPDWRGTNGIYYANQPSYYNGNYVEGVKLEFKEGNVILGKAKVGGKFLKNQLLADEGSSRLGEFSLTDKRFSKINRFMANTLFDENYGGEFGNCHIAIGASYADTYSSKNNIFSEEIKKKLGFNESSIHWDLVNTEKKRVIAHTTKNSNITIYEDGKFIF